MKLILRVFGAAHAVLAAIFAALAVLLTVVAVRTIWQAIGEGLDDTTAVTFIEALGVVAVAVVALQIAQTIAEEEVVREAHVSAPTRVRRFLSRFVVVIAVANGLALVALIASLLNGQETSGGELLLKGATIWGTNVMTFGLLFWEFDRGGPISRRPRSATA